MTDPGFENQIPPGNPLSCRYDVIVDTEEFQEGLVTVRNETINRTMEIVIMAQVIKNEEVIDEDTQFSNLNPLGSELGRDSKGLKFQFDTSAFFPGTYQIIVGTWPKGHIEQKVVCVGNNFTIGDLQ